MILRQNSYDTYNYAFDLLRDDLGPQIREKLKWINDLLNDLVQSPETRKELLKSITNNLKKLKFSWDKADLLDSKIQDIAFTLWMDKHQNISDEEIRELITKMSPISQSLVTKKVELNTQNRLKKDSIQQAIERVRQNRVTEQDLQLPGLNNVEKTKLTAELITDNVLSEVQKIFNESVDPTQTLASIG